MWISIGGRGRSSKQTAYEKIDPNNDAPLITMMQGRILTLSDSDIPTCGQVSHRVDGYRGGSEYTTASVDSAAGANVCHCLLASTALQNTDGFAPQACLNVVFIASPPPPPSPPPPLPAPFIRCYDP